ncbi:MAG: flagellar type III secretion system pore protein FliP [Clostridium sp.]|nr:flagellar type III secretion system pore protein FliP [Clostridium sp.]
MKRPILCLCLLLLVGIFCMGTSTQVQASNLDPISNTAVSDPQINLANELTLTYDDGTGSLSSSLRILLTLTLIALAPTLILMMTCFTRIIIVMHFSRSAVGTPTAPPNQVLIGLALILTIFVMSPIMSRIYETAIVPLDAGEITQEEALERATVPIRHYMVQFAQVKDVEMFMDIAGLSWDGSDIDAVPLSVLVPSFMLNELKTAFTFGFVLNLPFIVIDMVVASALMSMGMMMLPPTTISMPFKILLFVSADGWGLIIRELVRTLQYSLP